ncbi:MAG: DUF507 family protein [Nitrospirae bacterium]|nr:DUF507 family protein [Nitrospirota bacterium]
MRLPKERVRHLAESLATRLVEAGHVELTGQRKALVESLDKAVTEELMVEDRLNVEVRELMKKYEREIDQGQVDYQKMFVMIKKQLVKDRGIIL